MKIFIDNRVTKLCPLACFFRDFPVAFKWSKDHDVLLAREILVCEPFKFKSRSRESGQAWEVITKHLNAIEVPRFRVSERAVRDRAKLLLKNYAFKIREEERASGIEVPEPTELDLALEEILAKEKEAKAGLDAREQTKHKDLRDKANAEEMRLQAMEKIGDTKKPRGEGDGPKVKKTRRSGTDTLDFMREKLERDFQLKEEEMKEKRKERETQRAEQQKLHEQHSNMPQQMQLQQLNQRQQTQDMLSMFAQQSQQQNQTVLAILEKFMSK